jgi:hypothetical protein
VPTTITYNEERPHQGRWCFGKTPLQAFLDAKPLEKEKFNRRLNTTEGGTDPSPDTVRQIKFQLLQLTPPFLHNRTTRWMSTSTRIIQTAVNALAGLQRSVKLAPVLTLAVISGSARAAPAVVHSCDRLDSIANLVEPVRGFANNAIRIAHVSTEEPAAAPDHLLVFVSLEPMGDECFAVSAASHDSEYYQGFCSLNVAKARTSYDAQKGLLVWLPVSLADPDKGVCKSAGDIKVRVNRKNGNSVTIQ